MGTAATATTTARAGTVAVRPAEFRAALERALELADADERIGPLIGATRLRLRFLFTDCGLALNVAAPEGGKRNLEWSFADDPGWSAKLELEMDSAIANRYLQGRESLAIAIVRGQVRVRGESHSALLYLPAARLICQPYRQVIETEFPSLVAA